MVTMNIESVSNASSTQITLGGFVPQTTYHKYEDDYHNHTAFITDANGSYTYTQDLSDTHLVFIQPRPSTKFINDNATGGDCTSIGIWDAANKTCTLTTDLTGTVQIDSDGITLNGDGHTLMGSDTGNGVYLSGRNGITIKNLDTRKFNSGIYLFNGSYNNIIGNNASVILRYGGHNNITGNNASGGISITYSSYNNITGNNASYNSYNGIYILRSHYNNITCNNASYNSQSGIYQYSGTSNNIIGNTALYNNNGISLSYHSNSNNLIGNTASYDSRYGIFIYFSSSNNITGNNASYNSDGINLNLFSGNNNIIGNAISNNVYGIFGGDGTAGGFGKNTLTDNTISNNSYGIEITTVTSPLHSNNWTIFNNYFNNTNNSIISSHSTTIYPNNYWNTTKKPDTNIVGGPYLGGNFWAYPNGTGFSQTCTDVDRDGICDLPYVIDANNTDYLPLSMNFTVRYTYGGILQPINPDGSSTFKYGSTIPVKFQLTDSSGNFVTNATAKIYMAKISDGIIGTEMGANSTSKATTGNLFRYDSTSNQYIFNLATKTLSTGTWQIRIELDDGTSKYVTISLR